MDFPQKYLLEALSRSPLWAIRAEYPLFAVLQSAHMSGWEAAQPYSLQTPKSKIAVIPVQGVLTKNGPKWMGSNYNAIAQAVEKASDDPEVAHIVLSVDSPGGEVTGLPEAAATIARAAQTKPVHAFVDGMSASAAYFLSSQANDIHLTTSGDVGSVGVRVMHADVSKMMDDWGVKVTELYSGDFKTEWSPYKPLSDDAKANMQTRLEGMHDTFIQAVTTGRGSRATDEAKAQRFGEGRMFTANEALRLGLVDQVQTAAEFYRSITPAPEPETPRFGLAEEQKKQLLSIARTRITEALPE